MFFEQEFDMFESASQSRQARGHTEGAEVFSQFSRRITILLNLHRLLLVLFDADFE